MPVLIIALAAAAAVDTTPDATDAADRITAGLAAEAPWLTPSEARQHALAALAAETPDVPAEVLLGLAWRESRYDELAGPQCGVDQVTLHGAACRELLAGGLVAQYRAGAAALGNWWRLCGRIRRVRGFTRLECTITGYSEGTAAARRGYGLKGCHSHHCDRAAGPLAHARRIAAGDPAISGATIARSRSARPASYQARTRRPAPTAACRCRTPRADRRPAEATASHRCDAADRTYLA
jgi:hypothetical protein